MPYLCFSQNKQNRDFSSYSGHSVHAAFDTSDRLRRGTFSFPDASRLRGFPMGVSARTVSQSRLP
jgi:hypothetical protein